MVNVELPRPIVPVLSHLQVLYGRVVTFEEAPVEYDEDMVDMSVSFPSP